MTKYYLNVLSEKLFLGIGYLFSNQLKIKSDNPPVFIVSAGRSGSTLLRKLLIQTGYFNIPPESGDFLPSAVKVYIRNLLMPWRTQKQKILDLINRTEELKIWNIDIDRIKDAFDSMPAQKFNLGTLIHLLYKQYALDSDMHDYQFWGDKTPYLIYRLPWIKLMFPNAKIIHMVRDPRAVVLSRNREFGDSVDYAVKRWKWSIKCISNAKSKMNIMEVRYEDLVLYTDITMRKVLKNIAGNLTYEKRRMEVLLGDDHYEHHRNLKKPILKNKIKEWEKFLSKEDKEYIDQLLSFEMGKYGYKI
jgi:hypothetical protein